MKPLKPFFVVFTIFIILLLTHENVRACSKTPEGETNSDDKTTEKLNENSAEEQDNGYMTEQSNVNMPEENNSINGNRSSLHCKSGEYECNDGGCFTDAQKCNNVDDCSDGSDEDIHHCGNDSHLL